MDAKGNQNGIQRRWPGIYGLLAGFVVVTVTGSVLLNREIMSIYAQSVVVNQRLAKHVSDLVTLSEFAIQTKGPGNEVFGSHKVTSEIRRRDQNFATFVKLFDRTGQEIGINRNLRRGESLREAMIRIRESMNQMIRQQNKVFADIGAGRSQRAGQNMAEMDRAAADVLSRIADAVALVQAEQQANFSSQIAAAQRLRVFELLISLAIVASVVVVAVYGYRITQLSERHQAELEHAKTAAEEANLAKTRFLAAMSHEVRTPMNGVLGTVNALLTGELSPHQRDQAMTIKESGATMLAILDDILDLSKVEAGRLELEEMDFSIDYLIEAARALWESRARAKGIDYISRKDLSVTDTVRSDPGRVRQILFNLIGNALKFTEHGGIEIGVTQNVEQNGLVRVRFEVRDTGIGIDPEVRKSLFAPFKQADSSIARKYGGTGLGLAISRELAQALGGEIGVDENPGGGSVFWFTILAEPGDPENVSDEFQAKVESTPIAEFGKRPLRLLVAEDNYINQKVMQSVLAPLNCEIDIVENGVEAVEAVSAKPYDLVFMDVQMRKMDGTEATRKIRALPGPEAKVPIVALTANAMKGDREKYLETGMTDYLSKPFEPEELYSAITRCINVRLPEGKVVDISTKPRQRAAS